MISITPTYIHLLQKPECCAVTCLQMILYRRGIDDSYGKETGFVIITKKD